MKNQDLINTRIYYEFKRILNKENYPSKRTKQTYCPKMPFAYLKRQQAKLKKMREKERQYRKNIYNFLETFHKAQKATRKNPSKERYAQ